MGIYMKRLYSQYKNYVGGIIMENIQYSTEFLKRIRSVRKFNATPIDLKVLEDIVDCGRLAPTARNLQPWEFIVVTDKDKLENISTFHKSSDFVKDAGAVILVLCNAESTEYFLEDGCAATQTMITAADIHGLKSCWVAGAKGLYQGEDDIAWCEGMPCKPLPDQVKNAEKINNLLGVPSNYALISMIALGYSAENPEVTKRSLQEVLHWETF